MAVSASIVESGSGNLLVYVTNTGPHIIVIVRISLKRQGANSTFITWHREGDFVYPHGRLEENIGALFVSAPPGMSKPFTATAKVDYYRVDRQVSAVKQL